MSSVASSKSEDAKTSTSLSSSIKSNTAVPILYNAGGSMPPLKKYIGRMIEVRIPARFLSMKNKEVLTRQLWGTDIYTDDSDAVAILMHTGKMILRGIPPTGILGLSAFFQVLPGQSGYPSSTRLNYCSRAWVSQYSKCSLSLVKTERIENPALLQVRPKKEDPSGSKSDKQGVASSPPDKSFLSLEYDKIKMKPKRMKFVPDVTFVFNSLNEPCLRYALGLIMDPGMDESQWTSTRLRSEVLYFESSSSSAMPSSSSSSSSASDSESGPLLAAYELAREPCIDSQTGFDLYRWSQVEAPFPFDVSHPLIVSPFRSSSSSSTASSSSAASFSSSSSVASSGTSSSVSSSSISSSSSSSKRGTKRQYEPMPVPLKSEQLKILEEHLDWDELEWGAHSVRIRGTEYQLETLKWTKIETKQEKKQTS
eukprot:TRINITY_DN507_c0_g2_i1.p1 TRINITY_DN507_c0_g2~~TRINITY_DN507_c0_g2_i1.p1  ORF type:complete len:424 (-),score=120.90 TRINITY_DN507_c0_g2_i1:293-1564(-)